MKTLLLLAALLQDPSARIKELIGRLSDENIEERDAAADELVRIGRAALAPLKGLAGSPSGEIRGRAADLVRRIERAEKLKSVLGVPKPVELAWDKKPLREALAEFKERTGLDITCGDAFAAEPVTFSCTGAPAWKALADLCRAHGGLYRNGAMILKGKPSAAPDATERGLYVAIEALTFSRTLEFGGAGSTGANLSVFFAWQTAATPTAVRLELDAFADDRGTDLRGKDRGGQVGNYRITDGTRSLTSGWGGYVMPDDEAAKVSLEGRAVFDFVIEYDRVAFENPAKSRGTVQKGAAFTATLNSLSQFASSAGDQGWMCSIMIESANPNDARVLPEFVVRSGGKVHNVQNWGTSRSGRGGPITHNLRIDAPADAVFTEVVVRMPKDTHREALPFEFKDVPIK